MVLYVLDKIPGLRLRLTPDEEAAGCDHVEMGEAAYDLFTAEQLESFGSKEKREDSYRTVVTVTN